MSKVTGISAGAFETIIYEKHDGTAYITLNRPKQLNAYNVRMRDELHEVLTAIRDDPEVLVTIMKGAGDKAFCAGADLTEFLTAPPPVFARRARFARDVWGLFLSIDKPFICAMHGYVLGSGIEMAVCCDIRLASEDARFGMPETGLGIIPAAGGTQTVPRTTGMTAALEMLLTGRWLSAQEALRIRLINRIVPRVELFPAAEALAAKIKSLDPLAVRYVKQAVRCGLDLPLAEGLVLEARLARMLKKS
ncbi:MAG: enoyl-CoA hydratase/isomerase family protein [Dehalococcoidales bacterium]|nr:enoyl-CoA hydratase/isomerase family protein [Dehalococcoidales bacterium]